MMKGSAKSGTNIQTNYKVTIDGIFTREIAEGSGAQAGGTKDENSIGETIKGIKIRKLRGNMT